MTDCIFTRLWNGLVKKHNLNSQQEKIAYLQRLSSAGSQLWQSYREQNVRSDYSDTDVQNAYLLRYFPFYAQPLKLVLDKLVGGGVRLPNVGMLRPVFFGCGPAPELVGLQMHLRKHLPPLLKQVKPRFVDKAEWHPSRDFVFDCVTPKQKLADYEFIKADIANRTLPQQVAMSDCHLAVFQNCLNEVSDADHVEENIKQIAQAMPVGSIVVIIDRPNYEKTNSILQELKLWAMGSDEVMAVGNLTLKPQPNELHGEILDQVPSIILDNFCARGGPGLPLWAEESGMIFAGFETAKFLAFAMQRCENAHRQNEEQPSDGFDDDIPF